MACIKITESLNYTDFADIRQELEDSKKKAFIKAYKRAGGNVTVMANGLSLSRGATYKYLKKYFGEDFKKAMIYDVEQYL